MIVLFSESKIGYHSEYPVECKIIPITFLPTVKKDGELFSAHINIRNSPLVSSVLTPKVRRVATYLIGFDLDENGEFMAQALRDYLKRNGVKEEQILRTPLTEDGYIASCEFLDIQGYLKYRYYERLFMNKLREEGLAGIGIREILATKYLKMQKGKKLNLQKLGERYNLEGTSTITFITNRLLKGE